jgi:polyketide biosynthesis enoyl-CoA hydratase PksI
VGVIEIRDDGPLRWARLVDPIGPNALTAAMVDAIADALTVASTIRVVILAGGPEVFSSGASQGVIDGLTAGDIAPAELVLPRLVLAAEVPVVAAMAGHALGGGLALGLCADVVLFGRESRYGATFMNHGFTPGMGTTRLLEKVMTPALAHELLLGGEPMTGRQLAQAGGGAAHRGQATRGVGDAEARAGRTLATGLRRGASGRGADAPRFSRAPAKGRSRCVICGAPPCSSPGAPPGSAWPPGSPSGGAERGRS